MNRLDEGFHLRLEHVGMSARRHSFAAVNLIRVARVEDARNIRRKPVQLAAQL
jgi:hypothetical protein